MFFSMHRTAVATVDINIQLKINGSIYWPPVYLLCTLQQKRYLSLSLKNLGFFLFLWPFFLLRQSLLLISCACRQKWLLRKSFEKS